MCTLKRAFSAKKSPFQPIAAIWAILEHFYSEMAVEPSFHGGPLQCSLSLPKIPLGMSAVVFSRGKKIPFQPLLRRMVKSWLFRKLHFQPPFRQFSRIPPQEAERATICG